MTPSNGHLPTPSGAFTLANKLSGGISVRAVHRTTGEVQTLRAKYPFALVGRAPQAGIRLDDPSVSQCHAYLQLVDGVPYCLDLGSRTGVLWDDGAQGRGWVHPNQTIRIGMFDVQIDGVDFSSPSESAEGESQPDATLATFDVHSPTGVSGRFTIELPVSFVGRHPNCNLRFLDEAVAYFQCAIVKTREGVLCVDILSRTGTLINGRPVRFAQLRDGDLLEFGKVSLLFRVGPATEQPLALFNTGGFHPLPAAASADPLGVVVNPLREMMEQFQQCFGTMARMFMTMQQEHTAMMCEQMRQVQDLLRESRGTAPLNPQVTPAPINPPVIPAPVPEPKLPTPKAVTPDEARQLTDAHTWFLDRLTQKPPPVAHAPKPS